jgi:sulfate permease, SulP family
MSLTIPHALGLGLIAYALLPGTMASSMALWSAALPGLLMALLLRSPGVVYAPTSSVALLFAGIFALVMRTGADQQITPLQGLAITGAFTTLAFAMQCALGRARLATLSRFLPVTVTRGFAAGVGLSLILSQFWGAFGATTWAWDGSLAWHASTAAAVIAIHLFLQWRWPRSPSLLMALLIVVAGALLLTPSGVLRMTAPTPEMLAWPVLPDWSGAPWLVVLERAGPQLLSLALLMTMLTSIETVVFLQELETDHGIRKDPNSVLVREGLTSACLAAFGLLPSIVAPSRSRLALPYTPMPGLAAARWHGMGMLLVALTGPLWLHWLPYACLAGAVTAAGMHMLPKPMLRRPTSRADVPYLWQSWLVALMFSLVGGVVALLTGMFVSMLVLLKSSAAHAIRRMHLHGRLRSRHVRRDAVDGWLSQRMRQVAVFELQGIVSFGVAAQVVEQVRHHLEDHRCVVLDASRVPDWDETGFVHLRALARELQKRDVALVLCGVRGEVLGHLPDLRPFDDLDHALEWAEDQLLRDCPPALHRSDPPISLLGDLSHGLPDPARRALERQLRTRNHSPGERIFAAGSTDRSLLLVQDGLVTLSTSDRPEQGLRLAAIGPGMVFGEMGFLSGIPRTASAFAGPQGATTSALEWDDFLGWTQDEPEAALAFMAQLARMEIKRLGKTTMELRAAME